ncbi:Protein of unknown function [Roseovarius azorensis]|uniref:DUF4236 domain-containing protein n=1 Tax=Roseovarius azorensis TaxID=1287727 RepID=A0A1H7VT75_9RHOB|nr:DUF4236 domain-containing protein [Roseovarius azorensis]SEM12007.1 Protein of unknown function [Roseovarius azorensis]
MVLRFRRTMKIAPGVRLNLTKKGVSARIGPRGAGITTGTSGTTVSVGIPGSGLHVSRKVKAAAKRADTQDAAKPDNVPGGGAKLGFFGWIGVLVWVLIILWGVGRML